MTPETTSVHLRISRQLNREIEAFARKSGKTQAAIMREAAEQFLSDARLADQVKKQHADTLTRISALEKITGDTADNVAAMFDYLRSV